MGTVRIAWRNIWRNRRRTAITMAAVALNTAILIITHGLMQGFTRQMTYNATQLITGEVQLHAPGYLVDRSLHRTIPDAAAVAEATKRLGLRLAARTYGPAFLSQETKSAGALIWGVDPAQERDACRLADHLEHGAFLAATMPKGIVLGKKLAHSLSARIGSAIVVVVQAPGGSERKDVFTVTGILLGISETTDRTAAIINVEDFRRIFSLPQGIHELIINSQGRVPLADMVESLARLSPGTEIKTWQDLLPVVSDLNQILGVFLIIIWIIFFLAAGLGVLNTMLMATYERKHEFGVLKALGTPPWRIIQGVTMEAWLIAFMATGLGTVAGLGVSLILRQVGLDIRSLAGEFTVVGVTFDPIWRPTLSLSSVLGPVVLMWLVCVVAAIYPASMAARLDPVKTMYHV